MSSSHFSIHPEIEGLTLFKASPGPHKHEQHEHQAYSVIMLTKGSKTFHHTGTSLKVSSGEIAISNPGQMHGCESINNKDWAHRTWYINQSLMQEIAEDLGIEPDVILEYPVIKNRKLFKSLVKAHQNCSQGELLDRQDAAMEYLTELVKAHAKTKYDYPVEHNAGAKGRYNIYTDYLRKNLSEQVELKDLASCTRVQRNQVIKDFRHVTGVTPGKAFRQMRLDKAKILLCEDMNLATVATSVGFADQSHFTRCFRKAYGITPNKFRKLSQETGGTVSL